MLMDPVDVMFVLMVMLLMLVKPIVLLVQQERTLLEERHVVLVLQECLLSRMDLRNVLRVDAEVNLVEEQVVLLVEMDISRLMKDHVIHVHLIDSHEQELVTVLNVDQDINQMHFKMDVLHVDQERILLEEVCA